MIRFLAFVLFSAPLASAWVSTSVDMVYQDHRLDIREAEIVLDGPVDHLFDGHLSLAAHREEGMSVFEVHEAFLSTSKWLPRSRLKLGQFFLGIGRLNQTHRHEWPFISAPLVHKEYFSSEGATDTGIEWSTLLPLPFYLDFRIGITNGWTFGHSHREGQQPEVPAHYLRMESFFAMPFSGELLFGLNYLTIPNESFLQIYGVDVVGKWRRGKILRLLLQTELWHRLYDRDESYGGYLYMQTGLSENWNTGLRLEIFEELHLKDAQDQSLRQQQTRLSPSLSYHPSEFTQFRVSTHPLELQITFMLGEHPSHDF